MTNNLLIRMDSDPAGVVESPAARHPVLVIHVGPSVHITCNRGGRCHSGVAVHGDIDIIPAGVHCRWELKQRDRALIVVVSRKLLAAIAQQSGGDPAEVQIAEVQILDRFQIRDPQLEHLGWALKAEMESGYPGGPVYLDSLATAVAVCLVRRHSTYQSPDLEVAGTRTGGLPGHLLRRVLSHIEDNLSRELSLAEIATIAGMSLSKCKASFRESMGVPVHRYVIQRRVERAKILLGSGKSTISQIALETGFSHQSHLAHHMRRVLGVTPTAIRSESAHS